MLAAWLIMQFYWVLGATYAVVIVTNLKSDTLAGSIADTSSVAGTPTVVSPQQSKVTGNA